MTITAEQSAMDDGPAGLNDEDLRAYNLRDATNGAISLARILYSSRSADDGRHPSKFLVDRKVLRELGDALQAVTEAQDAILKAELRKAALCMEAPAPKQVCTTCGTACGVCYAQQVAADSSAPLTDPTWEAARRDAHAFADAAVPGSCTEHTAAREAGPAHPVWCTLSLGHQGECWPLPKRVAALCEAATRLVKAPPGSGARRETALIRAAEDYVEALDEEAALSVGNAPESQEKKT